MAAGPNEFIAVTGTNGKTTTVELIGAIHRAAGAARGRGRQRRDAGQLNGRKAPIRPRPSCARRRASSSGRRARFAPEAAVFRISPRITSIVTRRCGLPAPRRADLRAPAHVLDLCRDDRGRSCRGSSVEVTFGRPVDDVSASDGRGDERASIPMTSACGGSFNFDTNAAAASGSSAASTSKRCARRCASSPASRTGSSTSREIGGVEYVNDSKATNPGAPGGAGSRRRAGCTPSWEAR